MVMPLAPQRSCSALAALHSTKSFLSGDLPDSVIITTATQRSTRVAVTTTSDGEPSLFANYSRAAFDREDLRDRDHLVENRGFERQDQPEKEARVWEA